MRESHANAKRESKKVDFKRSFDPNCAGEWCEVLKDIVAMANTGGGIIIFGVNNDGSVDENETIEMVLALDPAIVTDKIAKYTGNQFDNFSIEELFRSGVKVAVLKVGAAVTPLIFEKAGTYQLPDGKQRNAFTQGAIYVRHGAKSEPATSEDIQDIIERRMQVVRQEWLAGVRKVVSAPTGSAITIVPSDVQYSRSKDAAPIRITDSPDAPEVRLIDPDKTHPWRQKELITKLNGFLPAGKRVNQYHIRAIRLKYNIDSKPEYFHKGKFTTPQYSIALYEWLIDQYTADANFFSKVAEEMRGSTGK